MIESIITLETKSLHLQQSLVYLLSPTIVYYCYICNIMFNKVAVLLTLLICLASSFLQCSCFVSPGTPTNTMRSHRMNRSLLMQQVPIDMLKKRGTPFPEYILEQQNGAKAVVRTYGGNVYTWKTKEGIEIMGTRLDAGDVTVDKPYSSGCPHYFPQWGSKPNEQLRNGFAKSMMFIQEERVKKLRFDKMVFKLVNTPETDALWGNTKFEYRYDIALFDDAMEWEIAILNLGDKPFVCTPALHTYYDVSSLKNVVITGPFKGAKYLDRKAGTEGIWKSDEVTITGTTDYHFKGLNGPISITDKVKGTKTTMTRVGYKDTIIWNPYDDKSGFDRYVAVYPAQLDPVEIPVGKRVLIVSVRSIDLIKCVHFRAI
jgi:D-hexose-6-phosphate mutarotase